eukprot:Hpha_TRINITY_DN2849_c0_g1::TRINITY_DN2849_c0_g1_i1::g.171267::m.171267
MSIVVLGLAAVAAGEPWPPGWKPGYPRGWDTFPGSLSVYPQVGGVVQVDPWRFDHRMGMYKSMIATAKNIQFGGELGSPLWGLVLQCGWQMQTGRHLNTTVNAVNTSSWWGAMNYALSTVPFISAVEAGLFAPLNSTTVNVLAAPYNASLFCASYESCSKKFPQATLKWREFFTAVVRGGGDADGTTEGLWEGHMASLHEATPMMQPLLGSLPSAEEQKFGTSWANLIDFVAALNRGMNFSAVNQLQEALIPPRMLRAGDRPLHIADFTQTQNFALAVMEDLATANAVTHGEVYVIFHHLCCTPEGRAAANKAADDALWNRGHLPADVLKVLLELAALHPCPATPAPTQW